MQSSVPSTPALQPLSRFLGQVLHGDCLVLMQTIPAQSVDLVVTDPPYLVNYLPRDGRRCANDNNHAWLEPAFQHIQRLLKPDSFCATFYGWPWADRFMAAWRQAGLRPVSHLVWPKHHCSKSGYTAGHHEVGYLLAKGHPPRPATPLSDVLPWEYTGNPLHPNQKPVVAITPLIEAFSRVGQVVLDPFAGSGTTGVAARLCRRQVILIEQEERLCQVARARLARARPKAQNLPEPPLG